MGRGRKGGEMESLWEEGELKNEGRKAGWKRGKERKRNESWWEERKEMGRTVKVLERSGQETGNLVRRDGRKG